MSSLRSILKKIWSPAVATGASHKPKPRKGGKSTGSKKREEQAKKDRRNRLFVAASFVSLIALPWNARELFRQKKQDHEVKNEKRERKAHQKNVDGRLKAIQESVDATNHKLDSIKDVCHRLKRIRGKPGKVRRRKLEKSCLTISSSIN